MGLASRLSVVAAAVAGLWTFEANAQQPVVTQLGWLRIGEYAPILIAEAKGFFKEEGIDHKTVDGGPGKNPIPIVAVGQAQFGLATNGMMLVSARLAKDPVDVVAVGTLFQQAPSAYLSIAAPDAPAPKPKDMEGKTVGVQAGSEFMFHAFTKKNGVDESKVKLVQVNATVEPLMVGKIDFFSGWVVNQTYQIEQEAAKPDAPPTVKGKSWKAMRFADYGIPAYTDVIFTSTDLLKKNPELVRHYLSAVAKGMQYVIDHPDESAELLAKFPGQIEDVNKLKWRFKLQNPLFQSDDTKKNGLLWMSPAIWDQMIGFLKEGDQIPRIIPAAEVMTDAYIAKPSLP
ncbi:NMT1/THI5 like [Enhydrobacter aerosaccus]|uniref:NMT1/THI5 like n=1 Tax=Enhydrobacter aerosaccus TaxID=225324 RepID=A0A1T4SXF2_9HYPH|nr:ABC transporter substrate-binding protein [Enhydrobacter aerosaccus]SKA32601.1 NMT1/THI5 like [Enhydrobacter aerosaccus]